jgi:penicillin-binding protein 2
MTTAPNDDRRRIAVRVGVLQGGVIVCFAALAICFWVLQVVQTDKFVEMANSNYQRTLALRAPRGVLYDRTGRVLVENRNSYTISIDRESTKNLSHTVKVLSQLLGLDVAEVTQAVDRYVRSEPSKYRPIVIVQDATLEQVVRVLSRRKELPEILVEEVPTRQYPSEALAAHLFGYVGLASEKQIGDGINQGSIVGQQGVEQSYNKVLMGRDGVKRIVVNSVGREIGDPLEETPPTEGNRLQLTIDYDIQKSVEDAFKAASDAHLTDAGAAVVLDPRTGEVLAFTSQPAFDPNAFASGVDRATWSALNKDDLLPLNNRALSGRYSPGSTFKMAVGLAALEEGAITPDFTVFCGGRANFYGRSFKCWKAGGHGRIDLRHAIEQSCDVFFYTVANMIGIDKIHKWSTLLGLGEMSGIDLPHELQGLVPSTEWKQRVMGEKWYAGETISVGIGQGAVAVTPVSMAVYAATLANGGTRITPHVLKAVDEGKGWEPVPAPPPHSTVDLDPQKLQAIRDGMWMVVNAGGTGGRAKVPGHDVAGKTGTSQVISNEGRAKAGRTTKDLRDNAWFVFFAPRDNPQIAGIVFLEHGMHGPNAGRVAHHILDTFFAKQDKRPLPPPPTAETMQFDFSDSFPLPIRPPRPKLPQPERTIAAR